MKEFEQWLNLEIKKLNRDLSEVQSTIHSIQSNLEILNRYADFLENLSDQWGDKLFSKEFLNQNIKAIRTHRWDKLGELFALGDSFNKNKYFALAAHHQGIRNGKRLIRPTLIVGQVLEQPSVAQIRAEAEFIFEKDCESSRQLIPVELLIRNGFSGLDGGDPVLFSNGWLFPMSEKGPVLKDLKMQRRRLDQVARNSIYQIFEGTSAKLLIDSLDQSIPWHFVQNREFLYHEVGHSTGLGLQRKMNENLLSTRWCRAVEEWRSDGVGFQLLHQTLTPHEAGQVVAANLALRFGIDSQPSEGQAGDADVSASLITFDRLLESGFLKIGENRKLEFTVNSYPQLFSATELHRIDAIRLTQSENQLRHSEELWGLYGSVNIAGSSRNLFQALMVEPCKGNLDQLGRA